MNLRTLAFAAACLVPAAPPLAVRAPAQTTPPPTAPPASPPAPPSAPAARDAAPGDLVAGDPADTLWTARTADFRQDVRITAAANGDSVRVDAPVLRGPQGQEVALKAWFGDDTTRTATVVPARGAAVLHLAGRLPAPGAYRGRYELITSTARTEKRFTVTLAGGPVPVVAVRGAGAAASTLGFLSSLGLADRVMIPLAVVDSVAGTTVLAPRLETLQRHAGGDTAMAVDFHRVTALQPDGKALPDSFALRQGDVRNIRLRVSGIRDAGRYDGTVRILASGAAPVVAPVTVYVRRSGLLALLLLGAGIGISMLIRHYQLGLRPRLLRQRRAAELLEWLAATERELASTGGATPDETRVNAAQRAELERIYDGQKAPAPDHAAPAPDAAATPTGDDARLSLVAARLEVLPDWVNARRQVDAIPVTTPDDGIRAGQAKALAAVREALLTGTADEVKAAAATARGIPAAIQTALKERLEKQIAAFTAQVTEGRAAHAGDDPFLKAMEAEVQQRLAAAARLVAEARLPEAAAEYDAARVAYAELLAKDLQLRLGQPAPAWLLPPTRWAEIRAEVQAALSLLGSARTPDAHVVAFEGAQGLYLRLLAAELGKAAARVAAARPDLSAEQKAPLGAVGDRANVVLARVAARDLNGAAAEYASAETAYRAAIAALPAVPGQLGGTTATAAPPAGGPTAVGGLPGALAGGTARLVELPPIRRATAGQLGDAVRRRDLLLSLAVAALAAILGMSLLWAGHLTWGSAGDMFAALLWGLGLHQAGTGTLRASGVLDTVLGRGSQP